MSGQRETLIRRGPSVNVEGFNPGPSVRTQLQDRAVPVFEYRGGLGGLESALAGFFGTAAKVVNTVQEIDHKAELVEIQRENERRKLRAVKHAQDGTPMDEEDAQYWSYYSSYQRTTADLMAQRDADEWEEIVRNAPKDGSWDYQSQFDQWFKGKYGTTGSGDPDFDVVYAKSLNERSAALKNQFDQIRFRTMSSNNMDAFADRVGSLLMSQQGVDGIQMIAFAEEAKALTFGDQAAADALMLKALTNGIVNRGQAISVLKAMAESDMETRNPTLYMAVTEAAWKNIAQTRTLEARNAVDQLQGRAVSLMYSPTATAGDFLALQQDIIVSMSRVGAEDAHRQIAAGLIEAARKRFAEEATTNLWLDVYRNGRTFNDVIDNPALGVSKEQFVNKHFATAVAQQALAEAQTYPALAATAQETGVINPLANAQAAREFGFFMTSPRMMRSTPRSLAPQHAEAVERAFLSNDPSQVANAYQFLKTVEDRTSEAYAFSMIQDMNARRLYQRVRDGIGLRTDITPEAFVQQIISKSGRGAPDREDGDGMPNFAPLIGEKDRSAANETITTAVTKALRQSKDLERSFGWLRGGQPHITIPDARTRSMIYGEVEAGLREQIDSGMKPDVGKAVKDAVERVKDRLVVLPGRGDSFLVYESPYAPGEGRRASEPLNTINGRDVFAPGEVIDVLGYRVNTYEALSKTTKALVEMFPDQPWADPNGLVLGAPDSGGAKGLFVVSGRNTPAVIGIPLPGGPKTPIRMKLNGKDHELYLPSDPEEAKRLLNDVLNPIGAFAVPAGPQGLYGQQALQIVVGATVEKDRHWWQKESAKREAAQQKRADRLRPSASPATTPTRSDHLDLIDPWSRIDVR